jgi:hypothetical protein
MVGHVVGVDRLHRREHVGLLGEPCEPQPRRSLDAHQPVGREPRPFGLLVVGAAAVDEPGDVLLELLAVVVGQRVVPRAEERTEDGGRALRVVGPGLAGEHGDGFHDAHAVGAGVVAVGVEDERVEVDGGHGVVSLVVVVVMHVGQHRSHSWRPWSSSSWKTVGSSGRPQGHCSVFATAKTAVIASPCRR